MLLLVDILIILSGISAAQAGLIRRYANTTSQAPNAMTGVAYRPYAGSPSLSLAPIQGITTLPFSQLAETPAETPVASSAAALALSESPTAIVTRVASSFQYQPVGSETNDNDAKSSAPCKSQSSGPPTSFWTFGDQHVGTVTRTSTTYITVSVPPQVVESSSPQEPTTSQAQNETTLSVSQTSHTFSFDPLPKTTDSSTTDPEPTTSAAETSATDSPTKSITQNSPSAPSTFAYPYPDSDPATTSSTATDPQSDATEAAIEPSSATYYSDLPVVVTEGTPPETQSQQSVATTTDTTAIPGITIIPQNPSVIYITVTDAGATTTVTA